jgi:hypothetical protein
MIKIAYDKIVLLPSFIIMHVGVFSLDTGSVNKCFVNQLGRTYFLNTPRSWREKFL